MAEHSALEIYMLQLINRARLDPVGEATRYGIDLNNGLAPHTISTSPKAPLAPNDLLLDAARGHSQWMINNNVFSHTGVNGSSPGMRMTAAGYSFVGSWTWGENISWRGSTGSSSGLAASIETQHEGLFRSAGHRVNILNDTLREVGVGQVVGPFTYNATTYNASMVTQNFAKTGTATFLTGVIYNDLDGDNFYDPGEGVGGVTVKVNGAVVATTSPAGAYAVSLGNGTYDLRMEGGGLSGAYTSSVAIIGQNVQINAKTNQFTGAGTTGVLSIAALGASKPEGTGSTIPFTFTVSRAGDLSTTHSATWSVAGIAGSGTLPANAADFAGGTLPTGTISFAPGETSKTLSVQVAGDALGEFNERFAVTLSSPSAGAVLGTASAPGIIWNDDSSMAISRLASSRTEGNAGATPFTFTVSRSGTGLGAGTVDWVLTGGGVRGTVATVATDFIGTKLPSGTLSFGVGQASQTITINMAGDTDPEGSLNESFTITLANPSPGVNITTASATGVVYDDDTIYGTAGDDTLVGTPGPDIFMIGKGIDSITGGPGTDLFRFIQSAAGPAATTVFSFEDFSRAAGEKLDLSRIDAIAGTLLNDVFNFIDTAAFTNVAGQLRWQDTGPNRLIQGDVNGDSIADLTIFVKAAGPVDVNWFNL